MNVPRHAFALLFLAAVAALLVAVVAGRAGFLVDPLRAQVEHRPGAGYSTASLAAWATVGGLGVLAYGQEAQNRPLLRPSPRTLLALVPLLAFGPLFHALLAADALPAALAWFAAEPLVYVTVAILVLALGAAGAYAAGETGRDLALAAGGGILLVAALVAALPRFGPDAPFAAALAVAAALLALVVWRLLRLAPAAALAEARTPFAAAIFFAHALDGLTTWIGVRDPFGWGVGGYAEKNPVSAAVLSVGNGWLFLALKLALPLLLLYAMRDVEEELHRRLALLAVFVLGFGPGAANALQMALRGGA